MYFSLGNYFWLMLNRLEHSKLIPGLKSESKIFLCNFHNIFLLSKIAHLKIDQICYHIQIEQAHRKCPISLVVISLSSLKSSEL